MKNHRRTCRFTMPETGNVILITAQRYMRGTPNFVIDLQEVMCPRH
jgi:hypothetical protein